MIKVRSYGCEGNVRQSPSSTFTFSDVAATLAGAGKSVLAYGYVSWVSLYADLAYRSSVIDSLERSLDKNEVVAYFYCDFRNEKSTGAADVIRSILSQVLRQLSGYVVDLVEDLIKAKERGGATRNNTRQLAEFALRASKLTTQRPLIVVDALDECKDIEILLSGLITLQRHARLFVTSRPLQVIKDGLSGLPFVSMDDMGKELLADIELHVTRELDARRRLRKLDTMFKVEIRRVLCCKADGM